MWYVAKLVRNPLALAVKLKYPSGNKIEAAFLVGIILFEMIE